MKYYIVKQNDHYSLGTHAKFSLHVYDKTTKQYREKLPNELSIPPKLYTLGSAKSLATRREKEGIKCEIQEFELVFTGIVDNNTKKLISFPSLKLS